MDEDIDKRKTAPPGAINNTTPTTTNNMNGNNGVKPPLRSSMIARSSTVSASDNSLLNNKPATTAPVQNGIAGGAPNTTGQRPPVRSASMIVKNSTPSDSTTPTTTQPLQPTLSNDKKIPPKVQPRSSLSINKVPVGQNEGITPSTATTTTTTTNSNNNTLSPNSTTTNNSSTNVQKSPTQNRSSSQIINNSNKNNETTTSTISDNPKQLISSNSLESLNDNSSDGSELLNKYLNDETNDGHTNDDNEDDTDDEEEVEVEEQLHDEFLKELIGNKEAINALKEAELKEMELLAGGTKFRVTRSFVGIQSQTTSPSMRTGSLFDSNNRVSMINHNSTSSRPVSIMKNNNSTTSSKPPMNPSSSPQQEGLSLSPNKNSGSSLQMKTQSGRVMNNPRISVMIHQKAPPKKPLPPTPPARKPMPNLQDNPVIVQATIKIQRAYRRYKQCLPLIKLKLLYRYRWNIVQEIYNTEKTYLSTIKQLSQHFIEPLRKSNLISQEDVKFIFGGIDSIYVINNTLLLDIEKVLDKWTPYSILGSCFTTMGVYLKAYTDYVKNFDFGLQRISLCAKDSKFAAFIKAAEEKTIPRSRLESLLITPVQRIPRYVLLLQDLLKHTEESHPDFQHLTKALDLVKNVAMSINDTKRQSDNSLKVVEVQNKLIGKCPNLVIAERRYVFEGYLLVGDSHNKSKRVYVFLFNDILIFSKPTTNKIFNNKSKFKFLKCEDLFPCPMLTDIPNNPSMIHCFEILLQNVELRFFAESPESKIAWLNNLQKVFNDISAQHQQNEKLVNYKKAEEKANDFKKYIDFQYTALKLKGKTGRGATLAGSMNLGDQQSTPTSTSTEDLSSTLNNSNSNNSLDSLNGSVSDLDTNAVNDNQQQPNNSNISSNNNSNSSSPPQQSSPQLQGQTVSNQQQQQQQQSNSPQLRQYPNLLRQTTFHKMSYQTRMETIKDAEEKTQQLLLEEQKNQENLEKKTNEENKKQHKEQLNEIYKGATVGRSFFKSSSGTIVGGSDDSINNNNNNNNNSSSSSNSNDINNNGMPQKYDTVRATKSTGAPSLNKIFSSFSSTSSSKLEQKEKEKEKEQKEKEKEREKENKKTMQVQKSSLNLKALNSELAQINNNKKQ